MLHLLAQRKAEELIDRFGSEDFTKWPFWAAGEAYATRGQAYLALGQQAKAQADLKAALALTSDPRTREKLLQTLQKLSPKQ
jgi:hypothetical protein